MPIRESHFATLSTEAFIAHLESNGLTPTEAELNSKPIFPGQPMNEGIAISILEFTGQRNGEPLGETSAK